MKKFIAIAAFILIGVIVYNGRYILSLGYNYVTWKPPIESVEPVEETTAVNPLDKYIEIPVEDPRELSVSDESPEATDTAPSVEAPVSIIQTDSIQQQQDNNPTPSNAVLSKPTMESIAEDYNNRLTGLENEFRRSLDMLIDSALADYNSGNYSILDLADLYLKKGEELEKASDDRFHNLLSSLEYELSSNGFETTMVSEIDKYYTSMKKTEKSRIVSKGMDLVKSKKNRP